LGAQKRYSAQQAGAKQLSIWYIGGAGVGQSVARCQRRRRAEQACARAAVRV